MKKILLASVSALGLLALAACEGGEAPPQDGTGMDGGGATMDGTMGGNTGTGTGTGTGTTQPSQ